jgi:hypothetical protein
VAWSISCAAVGEGAYNVSWILRSRFDAIDTGIDTLSVVNDVEEGFSKTTDVVEGFGNGTRTLTSYVPAEDVILSHIT